MKFSGFFQLRHLTFNNLSDIYYIWGANNIQESKRNDSQRKSRHSLCLGAPKETYRKEKHLCDKNLFKVDFVNHAAQLTFSGSSSLRLAKDPSRCKAFSPGICGKSCSRGPTASFSSLLLPQTNASYLQVRQKITEVYTY